MIAFSGYWLAGELLARKTLIENSWKLTKEALKTLDGMRETQDYGRTYNQLIFSLFIARSYDEKPQSVGRELVEYGEQAIRFLCDSGRSS